MFSAALVLTVVLQTPADCSSAFIQHSWELLEAAQYGLGQTEHAAFALRDGDGRVSFMRWPSRSGQLRADYAGMVPVNAFAIVHTHPNSRPGPSANDAALARRLGIPVYVVTRSSVVRTTGQRTELVVKGDWNRAACNGQ